MLLSIEHRMKSFREYHKLRGGIALSDLLFAMIGILFIMAIAYMKWPQIRDFLRMGSEWMELQSLQQAATNYTSLTLDGSAPTNSKDLVDGIPADGNGNYSITSNGPNGTAGDDDDMTVWY